MKSILPNLALQHAEETSFLWILRDTIVRASGSSLQDLARLDSRIDAHLDGLIGAGDTGWRICVDELKWAEPGEVFAASALAFASDDVAKVQPILESVRQEPALARAMIAALGFLPHKQVIDRISQLSGSHSPDLRFIGLSASTIHRIDPGTALTESLASDEPRLRARANRAVGELARRDLLPQLRAGLKDDDETARFWAAWSLGSLGDRGVGETLREFAKSGFLRWSDAVNLASRIVDIATANAWRVGLSGDDDTKRQSIVAAAATGDPAAVPWLIETMADKSHGRVAGESFTTITGADLALLKLDVSPAKESESGPTDDADDEDVAMDPDENLPWPDAERVEQWWSANANRFTPGKRYLLGNEIGAESLSAALCDGKQRHRAAAALEMMLANPTSASPLFEIRSHSRIQQNALKATAR